MTGRESYNDDFEKEWRDALGAQEQAPPPMVWGEIDRKLVYHDLAKYKSKAKRYQLVAAAILLFTISIGTVQYLLDPVGHEKLPNSVDKGNGNRIAPSGVSKEKVSAGSNRGVSPNVNGQFGGGDDAVSMVGVNSAGLRDGDVADEPKTIIPEHRLIKLDPDLSLAMARGLEVDMHHQPVHRSNTIAKKGSKASTAFWAGVDMGSGGFDPNYQSNNRGLDGALSIEADGFSSPASASVSQDSPLVREDMLPGNTVSIGVNFGLELGNRWTVASGVQYARSDVTTITNLVVQTSSYREVVPATLQAKSVNAVKEVVRKEEVIEYDYQDVEMENRFAFATIPLKAGYKVIDKRMSLAINAGLIANVYLGNELRSRDSQVAGLDLGPGSQSPYRDLSFSSITGVQFGYRVFENFDLLLEPNYLRALHSYTKEGAGFSASPEGFGISTGLRLSF